MVDYKETKISKKGFIIFAVCTILFAILCLVGGIVGFNLISNFARWIVLILGIILALVIGAVGVTCVMLSFSMTGLAQSVKDGNSAKGIANTYLCDACGRVISKDAEFCEHCGKKQEISKTKKCPKCGAEINGIAQFCEKCGEEVK